MKTSIYLVLLIMFASLFSAQAQNAPGVQWQKSWWLKEHPNPSQHPIPLIQNGAEVDQDNSGEDWIYDLAEAEFGGQHGCLFGGYTAPANYTYSGTCSDCNLRSDCNHFDDYSESGGQTVYDHVVGCRLGKMMLTDVRGDVIWYKALENAGTIYGVTQADDGGFLGIGVTHKAGNDIDFNPVVDGQGGTETSNIPYKCGCWTSNSCGHMYIVKLDAEGDIEWEYIYGVESPNDYEYRLGSSGYDIVPIGNGEYAAVGSVADPATKYLSIYHEDKKWDSSYVSKVFIVKIDEDGRMLDYGMGGETDKPAKARAVTFKSFGGTTTYFTAGYEYDDILVTDWDRDLDASITEFDENLDYIQRTIIDSDPNNDSASVRRGDIAYDIVYDAGNDRLITPIAYDCSSCKDRENGKGVADGRVYTLDPSNLSIDAFYSIGTIHAFDIQLGVTLTSDGGFAVTATKKTGSMSAGDPPDDNACADYEYDTYYWNTNAYIAKYDDNYTKEWERTIPSHEPFRPKGFTGKGWEQRDAKAQECVYRISQTHDGGYMIVGNNSANFDDDYGIKLYSDCQSVIDFGENIADIENGAVISTNTTWDTDRKVKGSVVVKSGATLSIEGCTVEFADTRMVGEITNIVVEEGGQLKVTDAHLTSIQSCEGMWDGIQVHGDNTSEQSSAPVSGKVWIRDQSTISDARRAIMVSEGTYDGQFRVFESAKKAGGLVWAEDTKFLNCRKGIAFMKYKYRNKSYIRDCEFVTDNYLKSGDYIYPDGSGMGHDQFISLWANRGLVITDTDFKVDFTVNPDFSLGLLDRGSGIRSVGAAYWVLGDCKNPIDPQATCTTGPCNFENLTHGITADGVGGLASYLLVWRNNFENVVQGVWLRNAGFGHIYENEFTVPDGSGLSGLATDAFGIRTDVSNGFEIMSNDFEASTGGNLSYGTIIQNSQDLGGMVAYNRYTNQAIGIQTEERNGSGSEGLALDCNNFINMANSGINVNPYGSGSIKDQGDGCGSNFHRPGNSFVSMTCTAPPDPFHIKVWLSDLVYYEDPDNSAPSDEDCVQLITQSGQTNGTPASYDDCTPGDQVSVDCSFDSPFDDPWSTQGEDDIDPVAETIDGLETELDESSDQAERNHLRSRLVSLYLVQDTMEAALSTLKDMEMPERAPIVAATYMELDSFTLATQWLDSLNLETAVDSNWKETFSILLDAAKEGRSLDSLSTSELADLEAIVDTPEVGKYESVTAQAVLAFVNGAAYFYKAQDEPTGEGKRGTQEPEVLANEEKVGQPLLGTPIPNPATSSIQLSCELPEGVEGILRLVDVQGRVWGETVVAEGKHLLELDLAQIPRGIVFCTLLMKDWPSQSKIVVIQ